MKHLDEAINLEPALLGRVFTHLRVKRAREVEGETQKAKLSFKIDPLCRTPLEEAKFLEEHAGGKPPLPLTGPAGIRAAVLYLIDLQLAEARPGPAARGELERLIQRDPRALQSK